MNDQRITIDRLIERFWIAPENAEWTPKTNVLPLEELRLWMTSDDIEVLGFIYGMIGNAQFRIEPALSLEEYIHFVKHYFARCFQENPDGVWSDSSYSAGWDFVQVFIKLWDDEAVPESTPRPQKLARRLIQECGFTFAHLYCACQLGASIGTKANPGLF